MYESLNEKREFEQNVGKQSRLYRYKTLACLEELNLPLLEEDIDREAFNRVCVESGCRPKLFKAELLGTDGEFWKQWEKYEGKGSEK